VFDGLAIYNALRSHPAQVTVTVDGLAASIASVIAMAGDRVVMNRGAMMMIHDASSLSVGNAQEMRATADLLDKASDNIASIYADRAGGTPEEWRGQMRAETWYLAAEAVDVGLADEAVTDPEEDAASSDMAAHWDLSIFAKVPAHLAARVHGAEVDSSAPEDVTKNLPEAVPPVVVKFDPEFFRAAIKKGLNRS
jgi:ClpP class serine protease